MSSNPKYLGPGYWAAWHIKTLKALDKSKKSETARGIAMDISLFPCLECRNHAIEYVKNHPLINAVNSKDELSLFKWTVDFHNAVNLRLGKTMINWQQAQKMWSGEGVCTENCGVDEPKEEEKEHMEITVKYY